MKTFNRFFKLSFCDYWKEIGHTPDPKAGVGGLDLASSRGVRAPLKSGQHSYLGSR